MLKYLYGDDTFGARLRITELTEGSEIRWVDKQDIGDFPIQQWQDQAGSSLFGTTVIIARDPSLYAQAQQEDLVNVAPDLQEGKSLVIAWDRSSPDKRSKFFRAFKAYSEEFTALDTHTVAKWIESQARDRGMQIDSQAIAMLVDAVGTDRWRLASELDRLRLLDEPITTGHITDYVLATQTDAQIFSLLDTLIVGESAKTMRMLEDFWLAGESEFYILSMLAYQFKTVLAIRQAQDRGDSLDSAARTTGLNPYVIKKSWRIAQRISIDDCLRILSRIMATDFAIKQGKVDARTAVVMLTLTLVRERSGKATV